MRWVCGGLDRGAPLPKRGEDARDTVLRGGAFAGEIRYNTGLPENGKVAGIPENRNVSVAAGENTSA
jgi:hypothetical protein